MKMYGVLTHLRLRQIKSLKIGDDIIEISKEIFFLNINIPFFLSIGPVLQFHFFLYLNLCFVI